jgi:preprotein translocase subunit YajC
MFVHSQHLAAALIAQAEGGAPIGGCAGGGTESLFLPVVMMAILYVVWILPARKERKSHGAMLEALKRNDEVVTSSGIFGTITDMTDKTFTIEIAKNVKIKVLRSAVARRAAEPAKAESADAKSETKSDSKDTKDTKESNS